jgi:nucleoside-diphosphate-sugar epimerase
MENGANTKKDAEGATCMKVLVTGATGFIGSHLSSHLAQERKYDLVGMVRDTKKASMLQKMKMEVRVADLRDPESLKGVTKDVDVVIHLAGLMRFHAPFESLCQHNVAGTRELAKDALHHGVMQFVYVSSTEAIGPVVDIPGDERSPYHPTYAYGKTKQLAEVWLQNQHEKCMAQGICMCRYRR